MIPGSTETEHQTLWQELEKILPLQKEGSFLLPVIEFIEAIEEPGPPDG